ncbi:MAG: acetamidase/formamidase family protein [Armatimonadetes bacterium]|nr:acetamidase/formamidase family protein [Armatimonadota bacterium]
MRRISKRSIIYSFSRENPPVETLQPGETVLAETWDAFGGKYFGDKERPVQFDPDRSNPATGPIEIAGAAPGMGLAVEILNVVPIGPGYLRHGAIEKLLPLEAGRAQFSEDIFIPLRPHIGVIGVAPAEGEIGCMYPGLHGGNMDTNDICAGSTLVLPVQVEGALLAMGDIHGRMADGESSGMGIELCAEVTLRVSLVASPLHAGPYILRGDAFILIASAETLDDAAWSAVEQAALLIAARKGVSYDEARLLISTMGELRISQIVNPLKTVRVELPKSLVLA